MEKIDATARDVADKIEKQKPFYKHSNLIVCGENSFGKSTLIKSIVMDCSEFSEAIYYIDSQNRQICDYDNTAGGRPLENMSLKAIVESRLSDSNYLKRDVFEERTHGPAVAYTKLKNSPEKYNELFWDFFGITIADENDNPDGIQVPQILVNDKTEIYDVSSSQAAKMRLLLEIDFAISEKAAKTVVIDEFDEFLTDKTAADFLSKLHEKYNDTVFIVSIQSISMLLLMNDFDIAIICGNADNQAENNVVRFADANSINEIGQIDKVRELIGRIGNESNLEEMVTRIVDTGEFGEDDIVFIERIERNKLSGREKILYDYVVKVVKQ